MINLSPDHKVVQSCYWVVSNTLRPHGLQHTSLPVLHHPLEFAQVHVHWISDAIQPSHPLPVEDETAKRWVKILVGTVQELNHTATCWRADIPQLSSFQLPASPDGGTMTCKSALCIQKRTRVWKVSVMMSSFEWPGPELPLAFETMAEENHIVSLNSIGKYTRESRLELQEGYVCKWT